MIEADANDIRNTVYLTERWWKSPTNNVICQRILVLKDGSKIYLRAEITPFKELPCRILDLTGIPG